MNATAADLRVARLLATGSGPVYPSLIAVSRILARRSADSWVGRL